MKKPTVLMILDGYGINEKSYGNAVKEANTPNLDSYFEKYPNTYVQASGLDVGLPEGQMGNSEVGHLNIGSGRVVYQDFTRITKAINDGDFFENSTFIDAMENAKKHDSSLHLWGLVSDGGVHSHNTHLYALLKLAKDRGLSKVFVHCFLDGRDVPPSSAGQYIKELEEKMKEIGVGKIATISGRYYAMDRDKRWERVQLAYDAIVLGEGEKAASATEAIEKSYAEDVVDEFVKPTVIQEDNNAVATVSENDSVIMFNFRPDRAREISRAFVDPAFDGFERAKGYFKVNYVCMTQYDATLPNVNLAYPPQVLTNTFGEYICQKGLKQLRIAETEKYAHVTFFFNGGIEEPSEGEDRVLIPSPKVATYDMQPEMSAYEMTDKLIEELNKDIYDVIIINYANPDMVGHTGVMEAAIKAVEVVDECVDKVVDAVVEKGGQLIITSDHGNSDEMLDADGNPITKHSTNPVPLVLINAAKEYELAEGKLADIAPTLLQLMDISKPEEMTGNSLLLEPAYEAEGETA